MSAVPSRPTAPAESTGSGAAPTAQPLASSDARHVLARTRDAYVRLDARFQFIDVNPAAERALGMACDALLGRTHWDVFPAAVGTPVEAAYRRLVAEGGEAHLTHQYVGGGYDVHLEIDAYGTTPPGAVDVFWRDVTAQVRAREALDRQSAFTRLVAENATSALFFMDADGHPTYMNAAAEAMTGYTLAEIAGLPLHYAVHHHRPDGSLYPMADCPIDRALPEHFDVRAHEDVFVRKDGTFFPVVCAASPILEGDRPVGTVVEVRDVSAERAAAAELEAANAQLREQGLELELSNQQLQEQAAELEAQAEELQVTAAHLEEQVEAAERARGELAASEARYRALAAALEVERARLAELFRQSPSFLAVLRGPENVFEFVNDAYEQIVGRGRPLLGLPLFEAIPEARGQEFDELLGRVRATGEPLVFRELPALLDRTAGAPREERFLDITYLPLVEPDEAGGVTRDAVIAHGTDVTDQVRARRDVERLLAEAEAARAAADLERSRLLATIEQLPVGVHIAEAPSGRLILTNPAVWRVWGEAPASPTVDAYSADYVGYHRAPHPRAGGQVENEEWPLARALLAGETVTDEVIDVLRHDGSRVVVSLSAAPVRDTDGRVVGGVVTSTDVTERERLLADSEAARRDAEAARARAIEANLAKSQFLANMSHELRTPLNAIGGYVQLIDLGIHGPVSGEQREALARVQRAQQHLLGLINDVLNYARLEGGRVEYDLRPVLVAEAFAEVAPLIEPQLAAKALAFEVRVPAVAGDGSPPRVVADRDKLRQVLLNLLSNAAKFTEARNAATGAPGRVVLEADANGGGVVRIRVRDTGRGIPADQLEAIFEPFVQVGKRFAGEAPGTGLGLSISRDLARGMGGDLTAASDEGEGSTFTLALPAV